MAVLVPSIPPTIGGLSNYQVENLYHDKENDPYTNKKNIEMSIFASCTHIISLDYPQGDQNTSKYLIYPG